MGIYSSKSSYYKLQQKSLYISHDKSYMNKFQIEFGLKRAAFNPSRKKMKAKLEKIKQLLNWKIYCKNIHCYLCPCNRELYYESLYPFDSLELQILIYSFLY